MIVVDTNIIAYLYLPGPRHEDALSLLSQDSIWVAPKLWRSEFANILAGALRRESFRLDQALTLYEAAQNLFHGNEYEVDYCQVLQTANASALTAYDSEFVVLAKTLGVELVTGDKQILRAFPGIARPL